MSQELHPLTDLVTRCGKYDICLDCEKKMDAIIRSWLKERVEEWNDAGLSICDVEGLKKILSLTEPKPKRKVIKAQAIARQLDGDLYLLGKLRTQEQHEKHVASIGHALVKFPAGEQIEEEFER